MNGKGIFFKKHVIQLIGIQHHINELGARARTGF